ncbi:MAG: hypothetical protein GXP46_00010 [Deferribacteres bacterium]|nr:hypothetical protein [Deferribacteres bacterium]
MNIFVIITAWLSVAVFAVMAVYRFIKFAAMPLHLRWELYPVAHESREKRRYGGSYMEEMDWVKRPRRRSLSGEISSMLAEIFFLHRVREHNRHGIWIFSICMHWGIYLFAAWIALLAAGTFFESDAMSRVANITGVAAFVMGASGSLMLAVKRVAERGLRLYTAPVDYFNLMFLFAVFATGLASWFADPGLAGSRAYVKGVISFTPVSVPPLTILNFMLLQLFLVYMPFTKLFHYIAKYFTFHKVMWDDAFKVKGSPVDKKIVEQLSYRVTWAAPHIAPDMTWLQQAQITDVAEAEAAPSPPRRVPDTAAPSEQQHAAGAGETGE